jgi:hypothetical protein
MKDFRKLSYNQALCLHQLPKAGEGGGETFYGNVEELGLSVFP